MNCDSKALMAAAKCMRCIPKGLQMPVKIYLLCRWSKDIDGGCGTPSGSFALTGAGLAGVNQTYLETEPGLWSGQPNSQYYIAESGDGWYLFDQSGPQPVKLYVSTPAEFPCEWSTVPGSGAGAPPDGQWSGVDPSPPKPQDDAWTPTVIPDGDFYSLDVLRTDAIAPCFQVQWTMTDGGAWQTESAETFGNELLMEDLWDSKGTRQVRIRYSDCAATFGQWSDPKNVTA